MTRRETLQMLASTAVLGALSVAGCGGGGSGILSSPNSTGLNATDGMGKVVLPTGFAIPLAQMNGETFFDSQKVAADGTFPTKYDETRGATVAILRHSTNGKAVLIGLVGPGQKGISAHSAAVALLALAMNVFSLPAQQQRQAVARIDAHPATATLANVISQRIVADPYALFSRDAQIANALKAAFTSMTGTPGEMRREAPAAEFPPLMSIAQGDQSMARVVQTNNPGEIIPVNLGRRPCTALTYRTGFELASGGRQNLAKAEKVGSLQVLSATTSIVGSIVSLNQRPVFAPVNGLPVKLTMGAQDIRTYFDTIILMASGKSEVDGEPSFFSDPKYATEVAAWRAERGELNVQACLGGIIFELFGSVIGGITGFLSKQAVSAFVAELGLIEATAQRAILDAALKGQMGKATQTFLELAVRSDIVGGRCRELLVRTLLQAEAAGTAAVSQNMLVAVRGIAVLALEVLVVAGTIVGLADVIFSYSDVMSSSKAERWEIRLVKPTVVINPSAVRLRPGSELTITANAIGMSGRTLRYKWKVVGGNAVLGEPGAANAGREIETAGGVVNLLTAPSDQGTLTVTVEVFVIEGATRTSAGTATSQITMDQQSQIQTGTRQVYQESIGVPEHPTLWTALLIRFNAVQGARSYRVKGQGSYEPLLFRDRVDVNVDTASVTTHNGVVINGAYRAISAGSSATDSIHDRVSNACADWAWTVEAIM